MTDNLQLVVEEVGRKQDILPPALPDIQTGVDGGCAVVVDQGVVQNDRMGWIDVGVPSADEAVERIEDQGGRSGNAVFRDLEVARRIVDDTGGVAILRGDRLTGD